MIRPITVICWLLALGSGLYLYRAKHEVELMDKKIEQIAKETNDIRGESRHLLDDWIRLGEPEQLHKYSDEYLGLKTIAPTQFARLSDLATRLPPPRVDPPAETTDATDVAAQSPPSPATDTATDSVDDADSLPVPPIPPSVTTVSLQAVTAVPLQARPVTPRIVAEPKPRAVEAAAPEAPNPAPVVTSEPHPTNPPIQPSSPTGVHEHEPPPLQAREQPHGRDVPWQPRAQGLPPLQAAEQSRGRDVPWQTRAQGLPPLQAAEQSRGRDVPWQTRDQGLPPPQAAEQSRGRDVPWQSRDRGQPPLQAQGPQPPPVQSYRPVETRVAGPAEPRREIGPPPRPVEPRPVAASGSLLGMSHGAVPLPLPAPTPVSASWPGQTGAGR